MTNKDNPNKTYRVYLKANHTWVDVPEEYYREHVAYYDTFRHRQQDRGQCACPKNRFWLCDGDCLVCEYRCAGNMLSLDYERENDDGEAYSLMDSIPDESPRMEDIVADRFLLEQLIQSLRELDPEGDVILRMWASGASDREIASRLGRPQRTFARQMKRYRDDCRRMRDE